MAFSIQYLYAIADKFSGPLQKMAATGQKFDNQTNKIQKSLALVDKNMGMANSRAQGLNSGISKLGAGFNTAGNTMKYAGNNFSSSVLQIEDNVEKLKSKTSSTTNIFNKLGAGFKSFGKGFNTKLGQISSGFKYMSAQSENAQNKIRDFGNKLKSDFSLAIKIGIVGALTTGIFAIKGFIQQASKIEDAVAGFTPLLGSVQKANELVDKLNKTAASTPFQFENISAAAKQLLPVMNQDINRTVETFRMLGDTAGGNAQKLDSITRGFTKSMLKGKVDMESLNMIAEAGVPIYSQLSASMGVSVAQMMKMSSAGTISSGDLTKAFQKMTSEGGLFYKGMEIASLTLSGKMSTLKDNIALTQAAIGTQLLPTIKPLIDKMIIVAQKVKDFVTANQELINSKIQSFLVEVKDGAIKLWNIITALVSIFGAFQPLILSVVGAILAYKTIMIATGAATMVVNGIMMLWKTAQFIAMVATQGLTAAQAAFNGVAMVNPIGLIIIAIGVLIGVIALAVKHWDKITGVVDIVWGKMQGFGLWVAGGFVETWGIASEFLIAIWDKIKTAGSAVWEGLKTAFTISIAFIKANFYTFADGILSVYGNLFKTIIGLASKVGGALGLDVSGLDNMITKMEALQQSVRDKSLVGGSSVMSPYLSKSEPAPTPGYSQGANANASATVSVFTEKGMGVTPFESKGNRGYNMVSSYAR